MVSFIITAKNEKYLEKTIADIRENTVGDIEILAEEDPGVGQRAMLNRLAKRATRPYIVKLDAHCSLCPDFDTKMLEVIEDDMVLMPILFPLDGETWTVNHHNPMRKYVFDTDLVMHHVESEPEPLVDSMCIQGSCFMVKRKHWFDWNLCDESLGSWGHQAAEIGIQAYLHGGRCVTTTDAYYGHVFRHKDEEFPYVRNHDEIEATHKAIMKLKTKAIAGLVEKFDYPADWSRYDVLKLGE